MLGVYKRCPNCGNDTKGARSPHGVYRCNQGHLSCIRCQPQTGLFFTDFVCPRCEGATERVGDIYPDDEKDEEEYRYIEPRSIEIHRSKSSNWSLRKAVLLFSGNILLLLGIMLVALSTEACRYYGSNLPDIRFIQGSVLLWIGMRLARLGGSN